MILAVFFCGGREFSFLYLTKWVILDKFKQNEFLCFTIK